MISRMWLDDEFTWDGELTIAPHPILPRPVQQPHPPLFMACSKKETVTLAAEYGVGALVLGFAGIDEVRGYYDLYRATAKNRDGARLVSSTTNDFFSTVLPTIVLDDGAEAFRIGARHGLSCLGCCGVLMLLLFAGGVMNLAVIAALTLIMLFEKVVAAFGMRSTPVSGGLLIGLGLWVIVR